MLALLRKGSEGHSSMQRDNHGRGKNSRLERIGRRHSLAWAATVSTFLAQCCVDKQPRPRTGCTHACKHACKHAHTRKTLSNSASSLRRAGNNSILERLPNEASRQRPVVRPGDRATDAIIQGLKLEDLTTR